GAGPGRDPGHRERRPRGRRARRADARAGCARGDRGGRSRQPRDGDRTLSVILRWLLDLLQRFTRTLDPWLCAALFALMAIALAVLYSAGGQNGQSLVVAQAVRYGVGLAAMWALSRASALRLREVTPLVYGATLLPLLLVLVVGTGRH